jgi:hypothetical protein
MSFIIFNVATQLLALGTIVGEISPLRSKSPYQIAGGGEQTAHACDMACFRQLIRIMIASMRHEDTR